METYLLYYVFPKVLQGFVCNDLVALIYIYEDNGILKYLKPKSYHGSYQADCPYKINKFELIPTYYIIGVQRLTQL